MVSIGTGVRTAIYTIGIAASSRSGEDKATCIMKKGTAAFCNPVSIATV